MVAPGQIPEAIAASLRGESVKAADRLTLDQRFAEAWLNRDDHRVVGRRLTPYCAQHALTLQLLKSPFVTGEGAITWAHVFEAAAVCCTAFERMPQIPSDWHMLNWVYGEWLLHRLTRGRLGTTLEIEAAKFRAYQNDYQSEPDLFFTTDRSRSLTAPALLSRAVYLQRCCGVSEERAWMMPIGKALWIEAAALEQTTEGVSLLEEEEGDLMDWIARVQRGEIPLPAELQPEALEATLESTTRKRGKIDKAVFGPGIDD